MNSGSRADQVDDLVHRAIREGVFPGAVILGAVKDAVLFHRAYGSANLFTRQPLDVDFYFDLASLTKPLATTLAILALVDANHIRLDDFAATAIPELEAAGKGGITLRHLLTHRSGYPAHQPYFEKVGGLDFASAKKAIRKWLLSETLIDAPGNKTVYSDLGYMVLEWIIESITRQPYPAWVTENIFRAIGIDTLFFPLFGPSGEKPFAATELCPWRKRLLSGVVHDDNAYVMGGASGHAGLFGTADGVWRLLHVLMHDAMGKGERFLLSRSTAEGLFKVEPGMDRPLGMDVPDPINPSCGSGFSNKTVGHLGFTGTSFWMDPKSQRVVILLSNRVHPNRNNWKIRTFRPAFHNAMMAFLSEWSIHKTL